MLLQDLFDLSIASQAFQVIQNLILDWQLLKLSICSIVLLSMLLLIKICYVKFIIRMTYQFRPRVKDSGINEELQQEMNLLRDYNLALEKQNNTRNEQRKALQAEIDRLSQFQRQWKIKISTSSSVSIYESKEYIQTKSQYSQLKVKYDSLVIENSNLTSRLKSSEYTNTLVLTYQKEQAKYKETIKFNELKISSLESKILSYESQISQLKLRQDGSTTISKQYQSSLARVEELQSLIRSKNEEIIHMSRQALIKDEETSTLRNQINAYSNKINLLSEELDRLEKSHKIQTIRYVQNDEAPILRGKIQQLNSINLSLGTQNNSMRVEIQQMIERIKDADRRIMILEQANCNLERQLRAAIQSKKSASRIISQEDQGLREAIYSLKAELQEVREFNQLVRQQNDDLYAQIEGYKHHSNNCRQHSHKSRSKSPLRVLKEDKPTRSKIIDPQFATFRTNYTQNALSHSHTHQSTISQKSNTSPNNQSSNSANDRYNELQRKIQLLQSENQILKHHLVFDV